MRGEAGSQAPGENYSFFLSQLGSQGWGPQVGQVVPRPSSYSPRAGGQGVCVPVVGHTAGRAHRHTHVRALLSHWSTGPLSFRRLVCSGLSVDHLLFRNCSESQSIQKLTQKLPSEIQGNCSCPEILSTRDLQFRRSRCLQGRVSWPRPNPLQGQEFESGR